MKRREIEKQIKDILSVSELGELFVVGSGDTYTEKANSQRFEYRLPESYLSSARKERYAIKYFNAFHICIIWKIRCRTKGERWVCRQVLSVDRDDLYDAIKCDLDYCLKGVEFKWRNKEQIYVVSLENLAEFLKSNVDKFQRENEL